MQRILARKDKLDYTMKITDMVPMATINVFLAEGCSYKIDHIATVAHPMPLSVVLLLSSDISLFSCGK